MASSISTWAQTPISGKSYLTQQNTAVYCDNPILAESLGESPRSLAIDPIDGSLLVANAGKVKNGVLSGFGLNKILNGEIVDFGSLNFEPRKIVTGVNGETFTLNNSPNLTISRVTFGQPNLQYIFTNLESLDDIELDDENNPIVLYSYSGGGIGVDRVLASGVKENLVVLDNSPSGQKDLVVLDSDWLAYTSSNENQNSVKWLNINTDTSLQVNLGAKVALRLESDQNKNLFILSRDGENSILQKVSLVGDGLVTTTLLRMPLSQFRLSDLAVSNSGEVFVWDELAREIMRVGASGEMIALSATSSNLSDMVISQTGDLIFSNLNDNTIRTVDCDQNLRPSSLTLENVIDLRACKEQMSGSAVSCEFALNPAPNYVYGPIVTPIELKVTELGQAGQSCSLSGRESLLCLGLSINQKNPGEYDLVLTQGDQQVIKNKLFTGGAFGDFRNGLSGQTEEKISTVVFQNRLLQAAVGIDKRMYWRASDDVQNWSQWQLLGSEQVRTVSNFVVLEDKLVETRVEVNGTIKTRLTTDGIVWSGWEISQGMTAVEVQSVYFKNKLWQYVVGMDNEIYARNSLDGQNWSGWSKPLSGQTRVTLGLVSLESKLVVALTDLKGNIYLTESADGENWSNTFRLDGQTRLSASLSKLDFRLGVNQSELLYLSVVGLDGKIYTRFKSPRSGWSNWQSSSGDTNVAIQTQTFNNNMWQFAVGLDGHIYARKLGE